MKMVVALVRSAKGAVLVTPAKRLAQAAGLPATVRVEALRWPRSEGSEV